MDSGSKVSKTEEEFIWMQLQESFTQASGSKAKKTVRDT